MQKIFLTGINGFLGFHVAKALIYQGYFVIGLTRQKKPGRLLHYSQVDLIEGDLLSPETYRIALISCDAVVHTAAVTSFSVYDNQVYYRINHEGTKLLLECAQESGIRKFIHISSRGTLGVASPPEASDETCSLDSIENLDDYMKSKFLAEQAVLDYARNKPMECVVLSPTAIVGSNDEKPTPIGRIIKSMLKGKIKFYLEGGVNLIDVEDAAQGIVSALEKGKNGEIYILGNKNITLSKIFRIVSETSKKKLLMVKVPYPFGFTAAAMLKYFCIITGRPVFATPHKVYTLKHFHSYCTAKKAVTEIGLPQTPIEMTLEKTVNWFQHNS